MKRWTHLGAALTLSAMASVGYAQQAPSPPDPATIVIPQPACEKPPTNPGLGATQAEQVRWNKRVNAYGKCIQEYTKNIEATAKQWDAIAQKYIDSSVKAADDFNAYIAQVRKENDEEDPDATPKAGPAPSRM